MALACSLDSDCGWHATCEFNATLTDSGFCMPMHLGENPMADAVMGITSFFIAGISLAAGVGGGGLFVPLAMSCLSMDSRTATALSQAMLVGGAVAAFAYNFTHHHPKNPERPLVDYELACLLAPALMAGAQVGSVIHAVAPPAIILGLLCLVLSDAARKGIQNALKLRDKMKAAEKAGSEQKAAAVAVVANVEEKVLTSADSSSEEESSSVTVEEAEERIRDAQLRLVFVWIFCIVVDIKKGLLPMCSTEWWFWLAVCVVVLGGFAFHYANMLSTRMPVDETALDFRELAFTLKRWSLFAGVLAAICGIGGGMVMGPVLVGLNVPPPVSAATTATTLLLLASSICVVYVVRGFAPPHYSMFLCVATSTGALCGKVVIGRWVARTGKDYIIVWCLAGITIVSTLLMGSLGIYKVYLNPAASVSFQSLCPQAAAALVGNSTDFSPALLREGHDLAE